MQGNCHSYKSLQYQEKIILSVEIEIQGFGVGVRLGIRFGVRIGLGQHDSIKVGVI